MTVTFNNKGVLVNNNEGKTVIKGHLDNANNLYMVLMDNINDVTFDATEQPVIPIITRNIV